MNRGFKGQFRPAFGLFLKGGLNGVDNFEDIDSADIYLSLAQIKQFTGSILISAILFKPQNTRNKIG